MTEKTEDKLEPDREIRRVRFSGGAIRKARKKSPKRDQKIEQALATKIGGAIRKVKKKSPKKDEKIQQALATKIGGSMKFHDKHHKYMFETGNLALTGVADGGTIIVGESTETIEFNAEYSLEQHFDHRVRIEIESQMNTPVTVAWTTQGLQKMSNIIATFPISTKTQTSILLNSEGVATQDVRYQTDVLLGDITFRKAEHKVSERYVLNSSQFFHNIRLEVFMVRKEWNVAREEFDFAKEKMVYQNGESWTAKLRFRSI